jgi:hypothetical protein
MPAAPLSALVCFIPNSGSLEIKNLSPTETTLDGWFAE